MKNIDISMDGSTLTSIAIICLTILGVSVIKKL